MKPPVLKSNEVRNRFVDYFKRHGHTHVPSSPLVPENDQTILFTNAGMVQFKNVFLGIEKRDYKRATTYQKCVRAGGKHNDLENVGFTARHHTFFEMLGNFSFGDYFKKDAIRFAWEFLTQDLKIPKDRLYVSIYTDDNEAFGIWTKRENVPADRISRFGEKDNFWQMGDTGPCGPCSEIFYDHGAEHGCGKPDCKVGCSCDRFVEIWNLVFMQFNRDAEGKLTPLPKPSIDTGAGLERMTAVMQGVSSNYDTDLFTELFTAIEEKTGKTYKRASDEEAVAFRVLADHARSTSFLIADGVLPSNEGAGYVLRRIMRRGIRYGRKLATGKSLIVPTIEAVIKNMQAAYPELKARESLILETVKAEENRFLVTLDQGIHLLNQAISQLRAAGKKIVPGETVFNLYDTFGFPVDLTALIAQEAGFQIDLSGFEARMDEQRKKAQASWKGQQADDSDKILQQEAGTFKPTVFTGYETTSDEALVVGLFQDGKRVDALLGGGIMVTDRTPFYAEGGGQVGDRGEARAAKGSFKILATTKIKDVYFHRIETSELLKVGEAVTLTVSPERRATMNNHSATHLLHAALRKVLGPHVTQAGSLVEPDRLRFDFTHSKPVSSEELSRIEDLVNGEIAGAHEVSHNLMNYKDALNSGAMALFGEKYGDQVRVIKMGDFSTELCGGTHVRNTSVIRVFKIVSESGVSAGVRRIEAITGDRAVEYLISRHQNLRTVEQTLKAEEGQSLSRVEKLREQIKKLEADLKKARMQGGAIDARTLSAQARVVNGVKVISTTIDEEDREALTALADRLRDLLQSGVVVLIGKPANGAGGPTPLVVTITKDLAGRFHAGQILKEVAAVMGGKGGGRPDFAQGAAPLIDKATEAAERIYTLLAHGP